MKKIKMLTAAILALLTLLSLAGCGSNYSETDAANTAAAASAEPSTEASEAPTEASTPEPTAEPSAEPSAEPTPEPIVLSVGGEFIFGSFEQDGDESNGPEPIEWIVLETDWNRAFVISKYLLCSRPYNSAAGLITWETCELRAWLNGEFLDTAFDEAERAAIIETTVTDEGNPYPGYDPFPGADTLDRVYILSITEAQTLFPTDAERLAYFKYEEHEPGANGLPWWLRTSGANNSYETYVMWDGMIDPYGLLFDDFAGHITESGIRPVMWIEF